MKKTTLYRMGTFLEVDDPLEWELNLDLSADLIKKGYKNAMTIGNEDFPYIEIWEADVFNRSVELMYPFFALVEMECIHGRDLYFENWISVLHFLQNYTGWVKNLIDIQKSQLELQELWKREEREDLKDKWKM